MISADRQASLERSCAEAGQDWIAVAPTQAGIARIEAFFADEAYRPHRHDSYSIGYTLTGVQRFDYRGRTYDSLPGDVIVLHPDERHNGRSGDDGGFRYRMLYLEPALIWEAVGQAGQCLPFISTGIVKDSGLRGVLEQAFELSDRELAPLAADHIVLAVAEALAAHDGGIRPARTSPINRSAVTTARDYLADHCRRTVTSDELAVVSGLSRFELARQFKHAFGTSPHRYLTMRRLDAARTDIAKGLSLAEVAADCGFADQSHLTRQFKAAFGLTPGRWRAICQPSGQVPT